MGAVVCEGGALPEQPRSAGDRGRSAFRAVSAGNEAAFGPPYRLGSGGKSDKKGCRGSRHIRFAVRSQGHQCDEEKRCRMLAINFS